MTPISGAEGITLATQFTGFGPNGILQSMWRSLKSDPEECLPKLGIWIVSLLSLGYWQNIFLHRISNVHSAVASGHLKMMFCPLHWGLPWWVPCVSLASFPFIPLFSTPPTAQECMSFYISMWQHCVSLKGNTPNSSLVYFLFLSSGLDFLLYMYWNVWGRQ